MRVRLDQRVDDLDRDRERLVDVERRPANADVERFAIHVLHRDEASAVDLGDFEHRADVRMIERRRRPGFAQQALLGVRVRLGFGR